MSAATRTTRLQSVPASRGVLWARQGFVVFSRKPLAFSSLLAAFLFAALVMVLVPFIGPLLLVAYLPLVSLGFMLAGQLALHDRFPLPGLFILPLRQDRARTLAHIKLGIAYAVGTVAIIAFSEWIDGGRFAELQELLSSGKAEPETAAPLLNDPRLQWGLVSRFGLATLLSIPFWHAPALVHWSGQSAAKALFSSTLACWRNKGAFTIYGLTWAALLLVIALGSSMVFGLLGAPQLVSLLAVPVALLFTTAFYASLFFTFADCFELGPLSDATAEPEPTA